MGRDKRRHNMAGCARIPLVVSKVYQHIGHGWKKKVYAGIIFPPLSGDDSGQIYCAEIIRVHKIRMKSGATTLAIKYTVRREGKVVRGNMRLSSKAVLALSQDDRAQFGETDNMATVNALLQKDVQRWHESDISDVMIRSRTLSRIQSRVQNPVESLLKFFPKWNLVRQAYPITSNKLSISITSDRKE